jgi:pimeloyl-ACP methyl ester carboxylesterase
MWQLTSCGHVGASSLLKAFGGGRMFGMTYGSAPYRVLALPGWLHTSNDYAEVLPVLGCGAIALDLPGFGGASPEPPEAMGSAGYAEAVAPVLLGDLHPPVVVVGHSFGGRVALHLAANYPDQVAALVLSGVPNLFRRHAPPKSPPLGFRLARALNRRGLLPDERMEAIRRRSGSSDYRNAPSATMRSVLVAVTNEHYEDQLAAIRCPVELVWGEADEQASVALAERAAEVLGARATLTTLPGVGHFVPTLRPDAIIDAIKRNLS